MQNPLVSIIVVSYNHAKFIRENLDSIKAQTYSNIQLIVADDASSDNSIEIFDNWLFENSYSAVKNFHQKNTGFATILNECLKLATGKYLKIIAADDFLSKDSIRICVENLEKLGDEYAVYYGNMKVVDENSRQIEDKDNITFPENYKIIQGSCFLENINNFIYWIQAAVIRLDYIKKAGFQFEKKYISEDWYLEIYLSRLYKISGENTVFCNYRKVETSVTRQNWVPSNTHNILFSHFVMISSFLDHPKNSYQEEKVIIDKLIAILLSIKNKKLPFKIFKMYFLLLFKTKRQKYILRRAPTILKKILK